MIFQEFSIPFGDIPPYISLKDPKKALFMDIETTGFLPGQAEIYLIGCAYFRDGIWYGRQWLSESLTDELTILKEFMDFQENFDLLIHFNGEAFDVPFIEKTCRSYRLPCSLSGKKQLDLMKTARKCKTVFGLTSMKQKEIEAFLGVEREDIFSGGELIEVYREYKRTKDLRLQKALLLHNADDVRGMLPLLSLLSYYEALHLLPSLDGLKWSSGESEDCLQAEIIFPFTFPKAFKAFLPSGVLVSFSENTVAYRIPLVRKKLRSYLPHPENYFYLPEEDMVIHKKLACTVDSSHKVKAKREQCFVASSGPFLAAYKGCTLPLFRESLENRDAYILLKDTDLFDYLTHLF